MSCDCYSIEEEHSFSKMLVENDVIAVFYPIYGSCVPKIMRDFVDRHKVHFAYKKLIIVCTQMMFSGDGAKAFHRLLPDCEVLYAEHINMPNNISNFFLFPVSDKEKQRKLPKAEKKIQSMCEDIKQGKSVLRGWSFGSKILGLFQNLFWPTMERKGAASFATNENCNCCGLCAKVCPTANIEIRDSEVVQQNRCTLCYRCVNSCPKKAATVLLHTQVKTQYHI